MASKTYVVIGSNCFTGSHIVDALLTEPDSKVIGVSRSPEYSALFLPYKNRDSLGSNWQFQQIDIRRDFEKLARLLDREKPQIVVNVAALSEVAVSNERPVEYFETNTLSTVKLADFLRSRTYLERYVHISSAEIFGSCDGVAGDESRFNPSTPYAVSKAAADMYLNVLMKNFDFPAIIIRSTNVYGKYQQLYKIIPRTIIWLKMGRTLELHNGGTAVKSFIHVRDVVDGLLRAIHRGRSGTYQFSVSSPQTVADIIKQITDMTGYDFDKTTRVVGERLGQDVKYEIDTTRSREELDWKPRVDFADGLAEVIDWLQENWDAVRSEPLEYIHRI